MQMLLVPRLHGLHRRLAAQRWLRQWVAVQGHMARQGLLHVLAAGEPVGLQNIRYAAIEPLDHAVGSRFPGLGRPMLYAQLLAQRVEPMVATGLTLAAGKQPVGELLTVVGQQLVDPDRAGLVQCLQEGLCTGGRLGWPRSARTPIAWPGRWLRTGSAGGSPHSSGASTAHPCADSCVFWRTRPVISAS